MTTPIDFSAFTIAMPDEEIAAYRSEPAAKPVKWDAGTIGCLVVVIVVLLAVVAAGILSVVWAVASAVNGSSGPAIGVGSLGLLIGGFIVVVALASRGPIGRGPWEQWTRLDRFARENSMRFRASDEVPPFAGLIFSIGERRVVSNHLSAIDGSIDIGNLSYSASATSKERQEWGYLAIRLERALPHFVLDSTSNNGVLGSRGLPREFAGSQRLSLEGDFDRHFRLYAPTGSETDALYVFTPDLMALLIDEAAPYDVEIVDDWMFVYSPTPFDHTSAATYWRLFRIVDTVGAKTLSQTDRFVDATAPDFAANVVAPAARRLRRPRISVAAIGSGLLTAIGVALGIAIGAVALLLLVLTLTSVL